VLFLLHAPLSQRGFYFFDCRNIGERSFLRTDFTIECFTAKHQTMVPVALTFLAAFSFLFPMLVLLQLCRHRKHLHSPEIRHKFGFLYNSFNVGGEYWELHEVFRKMVLTGLLVFIPGNSRPAVAILVSVMAVASLNYVRPHKNPLVFWVAQASFLVTTFKYLSVILLTADLGDEEDPGKTQEVVGTLLVALDMTFMVMSFFSLIAVVVVLRSVLSDSDKKELLQGTQVVPVGGAEMLYKSDLPFASRWRAFDTQKALEHAAVSKTEEETQKAHDAAMKLVEERAATAHVKLMGRVKKRKSIVTMVAKVVPKVTPKVTLDVAPGAEKSVSGDEKKS